MYQYKRLIKESVCEKSIYLIQDLHLSYIR
ncbi:hypothetical protein HID58_025031 [Brassica napus]|uniref:Uncharacterized protein n=1 Tax=Brassica napus TaxID=3708 RepID=A0ABQ8CJW8_BRANA|nr:hypothetical protein HID58_025031 [Brassica napus]